MTFIPVKPKQMSKKKLDEMRRALILTAWQDYKLFGYRTEAVNHLAKQIVRARSEVK